FGAPEWTAPRTTVGDRRRFACGIRCPAWRRLYERPRRLWDRASFTARLRRHRDLHRRRRADGPPAAEPRMKAVVAFACGVVFATGLGISGMLQPSKILGFLD